MPLRSRVRRDLLGFGCALACCLPVVWATYGAGDGSASDRASRLSEALAGADFESRERIIEELGRLAANSEAARTLLIARALAPRDLREHKVKLAKTLAGVEALQVRQVVPENLASQTDGERLQRMLLLLGMMGRKAKPAVPYLLHELHDAENGSLTEGMVRVVLANVGYASSDNLGAIRKAIAARSDAGRGAVHMVYLCPLTMWVDESVNQEMTEGLDTPGELSAVAALALSRTVPKGAPVSRKLTDRFSSTRQDVEMGSVRIAYGLAIASMGGDEKGVILREVMKYLGGANGNHTDEGAMWLSALNLRTEVVRQIIGMLDDKDPEVAIGVIRMVGAMGSDTPGASPGLIRILKSGTQAELREAAANSLVAVVRPSELASVEDMLKTESAADVRRGLERAIRMLRLLDP